MTELAQNQCLNLCFVVNCWSGEQSSWMLAGLRFCSVMSLSARASCKTAGSRYSSCVNSSQLQLRSTGPIPSNWRSLTTRYRLIYKHEQLSCRSHKVLFSVTQGECKRGPGKWPAPLYSPVVSEHMGSKCLQQGCRLVTESSVASGNSHHGGIQPWESDFSKIPWALSWWPV